MQETWVQSLGQEDPLEKEVAPHSSTLAWKIPWMEEQFLFLYKKESELTNHVEFSKKQEPPFRKYYRVSIILIIVL